MASKESLCSRALYERPIPAKSPARVDSLDRSDNRWTLEHDRGEQKVIAGMKRRTVSTGSEQKDKADASNNSADES